MLTFPLTVVALKRVMTHAPLERLAEWVGPLEQAMAAFNITTPQRASMFLANVAHESLELTALEENLHYSAPRLRQVFPRFFPDDVIAQRYVNAGPHAIASYVYANRNGNGAEETGDGWTFRARGPIGLTFRDNYARGSAAVCGDASVLLNNPEFAALPEFGAALSAWYWSEHGCNHYADLEDFDGCCDVVNLGKKTLKVGDTNGFASRLAYLERATAPA